jgi:hypothetical protein
MLLVLFLFVLADYAISQETKVSKRKIERQQMKNQKKAQKEYDAAVKQHNKNQSKETRAMMKRAKKDSRKDMPVKPAKGKKCK